MAPLRARVSAALLLLSVFAPAADLRIASWNVSLFTGTNRLSDIQTVLFTVGPSGEMDPDVLIMQEIQSPSAATALLGALNQIEPSTWAVTYGSLTGTDSTSDSAVFYKPSKLAIVGSPFLVAPAGGTSGQPRDTWRFDFHPISDAAPDERIAIYDVHMKAGSTTTDVDRRNIEAQHIRTDSNALPANYLFMMAGDTNMQSSTQSAYQTLITAGANARGQFFDPIDSLGTWNNNAAFKFVHTQDPIGTGGMDDRHDQIIVCSGLVDGSGTDYVGDFGTPYSTTTWNDPNHSYRAWGNDGTSFNASLTVTGNQMVGPTIARAIINAATPSSTSPGGHCPVFLDLRYDTRILVSGDVALQNFAASPTGVPVTLLFHPAGSSAVVDSESAILDGSGHFSVTTSAPPGIYDISVKAPHWLRQKLANVPVTLQGASGLTYSLPNGDVNNDNAVTLGDFAGLRSAYGSSSGDPNWNAMADLNGDGAVTLGDFAILRGNYGRQGDD
jgi:hypothetical protein